MDGADAVLEAALRGGDGDGGGGSAIIGGNGDGGGGSAIVGGDGVGGGGSAIVGGERHGSAIIDAFMVAAHAARTRRRPAASPTEAEMRSSRSLLAHVDLVRGR